MQALSGALQHNKIGIKVLRRCSNGIRSLGQSDYADPPMTEAQTFPASPATTAAFDRINHASNFMYDGFYNLTWLSKSNYIIDTGTRSTSSLETFGFIDNIWSTSSSCISDLTAYYEQTGSKSAKN